MIHETCHEKITIGKKTNNIAELQAVIDTYEIIYDDIIVGRNIVIVSDSVYVIRCMTTYGNKCCKTNWKEDIPNKELVKYAYELYKDKINVKFIRVNAHTGNSDVHSIGNHNADKLAKKSISSSITIYI